MKKKKKKEKKRKKKGRNLNRFQANGAVQICKESAAVARRIDGHGNEAN